MLSRLRRIHALLDGGTDSVDDLSAATARALDLSVCQLIIRALDASNVHAAPMLRFAGWAARADYHLPVEVFTVNYDLLLETALEGLSIPYFDGFVGAMRARFRTDLVEATAHDGSWFPAFVVRLWKLHGSVNWAWEGADQFDVVRHGAPVAGDRPAAIYPSDAKYDESRRAPFVVLQDRFRRALHHPETLVLISGYSFSDNHLNEMIFDAARRRPRSEFVAFCFGNIPDNLANVAVDVPNLQAVGATEAILGGVTAGWEAPASAPPDLWAGDAFGLGDFANLASFLSRSSPPSGDLESRLGELLLQAAANPHG